MKTTALEEALILIAEKRNSAAGYREKALETFGVSDVGYWEWVGFVDGLQTALDICRNAGLPVNSAELVAARVK